MKRYEVMIDGQPQGWVEGLDSSLAIQAAYAEHGYNPRQSLSLRRDELSMHILIDSTNWKAIARHDSSKALAALALIQFNNADTVIVRCGENKNFSMFDAAQLSSIAASIGVDLSQVEGYAGKIKAMRQAIETTEWLALPFTTEQLSAQAYGIDPEFDRPLAFDPEGQEPKALKKWHVEPQRNRQRQDSPHWHSFAAGLGYGPGVTTPEALAHLAGEGAPARAAPPRPSRAGTPGAATTPKAPKAPKPPRAPAAPSARPKEGTSTGKVWSIADTVRAANPSLSGKELKAPVLAACVAEGINAGTVNVQFSKWRSSNGL